MVGWGATVGSWTTPLVAPSWKAPGPAGTASSARAELDLHLDGLIITGSWTERTAADGYYRGAVYRGVLQLVVDPTGRSMTGRWLGPDNRFTINSGEWRLVREVPGQDASTPD